MDDIGDFHTMNAIRIYTVSIEEAVENFKKFDMLYWHNGDGWQDLCIWDDLKDNNKVVIAHNESVDNLSEAYYYGKADDHYVVLVSDYSSNDDILYAYIEDNYEHFDSMGLLLESYML